MKWLILLLTICATQAQMVVNPYRFASGPDVTAPVLAASTINATAVSLSFPEPVFHGAGYNDADWSITIDGGTTSLTYVSGNGTSTHIYTSADAAASGHVCTINFNGDADSMEDAAGNDLAAIVAGPVTNSTAPSNPLPPQSAVLGWWAFEEPSGSLALDSSPRDNDFTSADYPSRTTGRVGFGMDFESSNNNYFLKSDATSADFEFGDESFSVCGWFMLESIPAFKSIIGKYSTGNLEWLVSASTTTPGFTVSPDGTAGTAVNPPVTLVVSTWYFFYAEYNAATDTIGMSLNNAALTTAAFSGALFNGSSDFMIGAYNGGSTGKWDGFLDEMAVLNRVLTADERTAIYNSGSGVTYSTLPPTP